MNSNNAMIVVPFLDEINSKTWSRKMELLSECEAQNYIDVSKMNRDCGNNNHNVSEMLLRACRISCLDSKEMYFEPRMIRTQTTSTATKTNKKDVKNGWSDVIKNGHRRIISSSSEQSIEEEREQIERNFVSPRNESSAHAMAQTLLSDLLLASASSSNEVEIARSIREIQEQLTNVRKQTLERAAIERDRDEENMRHHHNQKQRQEQEQEQEQQVVVNLAEPQNKVKIETDGSYAFELLKWTKQQSGSNVENVSPCLLSAMNDARGLCATKEIKAGENILEIPRRLLLDAQTICVSEQGPFGNLLRIIERCGADTIMTLWIMKERMKMKTKQETFWSLYFLSLPDDSQKLTPLSWPEDVVSTALGNTPIFETIVTEREKVRKGYDALIPALLANMPEAFEGNHEEFWSYERYISALELWMSYAMTVKPIHSESATIDVLSPVAFFCNHGIYPHCVHYSQLRLSDESLVFPAVRDVNNNQEIILSYGAKSNGELLLFYGFCVLDNPYDSIDITLDFDSLNGLERLDVRRRREELLQIHDLALNHAIRKNAELPIDLIATLRILCCEEELVLLYDGDPRKREISMVSESKASDALFNALSAIRKSWNSSAFNNNNNEIPSEWLESNRHYINQCEIYKNGNFNVIDLALEETKKWKADIQVIGKRTRDQVT
jgi:hypothetical protein